MPTNIEIKARVRNSVKIRSLAEALADSSKQVIEQEDVFFQVPHGRLKLRIFAGNSGELIGYERDDRQGPRECRYFISRTSEPGSLKTVLQAALGVRGVVRKQRTLYLTGQTRIHLDDVEGLGLFAELEVVMREDQSREEGIQIAKDLMTQLEIADSDLVTEAYIDLLAG